MQEKEEMKAISVTQLKEHIYRLREGASGEGAAGVDAYLVCGKEKAVVIDGLEKAEGMLDIVRQITDKPVFMLVTHGHPDHTGRGMQEFMEKGFDIYIPDKDLYMVEALYGERLKRECIHKLSEGMQFDLGDISLRVMGMPGHTKGSALVFIKEEGILFSSDAIGSGGIWMQLRESSSLTAYLKEVEKLEGFLKENHPVKIYPGHGAQIVPYAAEGQDYLTIDYVKELKLLTEEIIAGKRIGEKTEIPLEELKGVEVYSVKGEKVADYCYDRQHILKKE